MKTDHNSKPKLKCRSCAMMRRATVTIPFTRVLMPVTRATVVITAAVLLFDVIKSSAVGIS